MFSIIVWSCQPAEYISHGVTDIVVNMIMWWSKWWCCDQCGDVNCDQCGDVNCDQCSDVMINTMIL